MKYTVYYTTLFKKDFKRIEKRGYPIEEFEYVVGLLQNGEKLPLKYRDHSLTGNYVGYRECHIRPDWLLVYAVQEDVLILTLSRTGTHSDLF